VIRPTGRNWWIFGLCAAVLVTAMVWLTAVMLRLDRENAAARLASDHQTAMSKALWRMDSWLAPKLAREAARPHFVYQAYYPQEQAYNKVLSEIEPGWVLTPSPLLTFRSEIFPLHFHIVAGKLSSPQVPAGNYRDLTQAQIGAPLDLPAKAAYLERLRSKLRSQGFELDTRYVLAAANAPFIDNVGRTSGKHDYASRARSMDQAKQSMAAGRRWEPQESVAEGEVRVGPLLPIWIEGETPAEPWLIFARHVQLSDRKFFQGFVADWPRLRTALLSQVDGLFDTDRPGATLTHLDETTASQHDRMLITVPARLDAVRHEVASPVSAGTVLVLGVAWGGLLISLIAVAFALHSTNQFGQRRARFASAVTHELRTPLTTFRMYSEMLAEGMVTDPAQRTEYLNTLKGEADRLARLVENVLSYARIEDGRFNTHPERIGLSELLERVRPILEQRTRETDGRLEIAVHTGVELEVDVDAITQILFNLIDNACKYASSAEDPGIELVADGSGSDVTITVRDHGPGIPAQFRTAIFRPFERAERGPAENEAPGVGLGLALARALAEDLGGRLELVAESGPGATFKLTIPKLAPRDARRRNSPSG
jgi:signal transduction histidine kinase